MESITIKVDDALAKEIDKAMKPGYTTKTEFIREAIRDKLTKLEKERTIKNLIKYRGNLKGKARMSDEEAGRLVEKELLRKYRLD